MFKRKTSIERRIALTLIGYTIFIVLLLWLFQILFLNSYYYTMRKNSIMRAGKEIAARISSESFETELEGVCFKHGMCCIVYDSSMQQLYSIDMLGRGCLIHSPAIFSVGNLIYPVVSGEIDEKVFHMVDKRFKNEAFVFAKAAYTSGGERQIIVMNAQLTPVEATKDILQSQLKIIIAVLLIASLLISRLAAQRLSRPIKSITEKARRLADGNYIADYDGGGVAEIDELAQTLNFSAQGLSKVEELRRELMANVSHDLKTPLTMIKAYAEMIRDLTGDDKQKRDGQLEVIISEADRLTALVNDLIKISREEADAGEFSPEPFDVIAMIEEIVRRFSLTNSDYHIMLETEGSGLAFADRERIRQALYNLISNAVNYTGEDKTVRIRLYPAPGGSAIRIDIIDSGRGIPEEELPLIWERYYRSKNTHQRPVVGTGLGLSIVRGLLTAQELRFGVSSRLGSGSCFWLELPRAREQKPEMPQAE